MNEETPGSNQFHFVRGRIYDRGTFYVSAVREDMEDDNLKHTFIFKYADGRWTRSFINNRIANFLAYEGPAGRTLLAVAEDGEVVRGTPGGAVRGNVDPSDNGPSDLRHLVGIARIGSSLLCCGMRRQVYRSDLDGLVWTRIDEGTFVADADPEIAGFWDIAGAQSDSIVAVGLDGELWTRRESWVRREVPTNANLYAVSLLANERVLVCGAAGVVLTGSDDAWRVVDNDKTDADLWSIGHLGGRTYLAGGTGGLFTLEDDAVVAASVPTGLLSDVSALDVSNGQMLLVGDQKVVLTDGDTWTDLEIPLT
jgi:hypothetical protein